MYKSPPMIETWKRPEDIIDRDNMRIFTDHYKIATSKTNGGEFPEQRLNKEITKEVRAAIAETYEGLRNHGFVPLELGSDGQIKWGTVLKSASQVEFEKGLSALEGKSLDELREIARHGWSQIMKNVDMDNG